MDRINYNDVLISVIHTCPFDSIFELIILTVQKENEM